MAVIEIGGGRLRKGDPIDHGAGISILAPVGAGVRRGRPLAHVLAASEEIARRALPRLEGAWRIVPHEVARAPHVRCRVDRDGVTGIE
jgi:thymidine phosphorylase